MPAKVEQKSKQQQMRLSQTDQALIRQIRDSQCITTDSGAIRYALISAAKTLKIDVKKIFEKTGK